VRDIRHRSGRDLRSDMFLPRADVSFAKSTPRVSRGDAPSRNDLVLMGETKQRPPPRSVKDREDPPCRRPDLKKQTFFSISLSFSLRPAFLSRSPACILSCYSLCSFINIAADRWTVKRRDYFSRLGFFPEIFAIGLIHPSLSLSLSDIYWKEHSSHPM